MSAEWLSEVLRGAGHADAEVLGFSHAPVGAGQFGTSVRFVLSYARPRPEHPATIVGKIPSSDKMIRNMAVVVRAYSREVGFHDRLRSRLQIPTPRCHHAAVRGHGPEFVLLLEDMHPAVRGDQIAGCDPSLARQIVLALVGLHSPTWRDASLADADWLNFDDPVELHNAIQAFFQSVLPEFLDRHHDELSAEQRDLFQAVGHPLADVSYVLGGNLRIEHRRAAEERIVRDYYEALRDFGAAGLG